VVLAIEFALWCLSITVIQSGILQTSRSIVDVLQIIGLSVLISQSEQESRELRHW
jgi:hypothetical protein